MIKNHKFLSLFAITLCAALLLSMGGKATRVFALADPVEAIAPVFDTEIIRLSDYVEQLPEQQLDIFFLLTGALAIAQLGAQDALLQSPYPNETSVKEWFINCGIQLYNSVIGLVPSGDYYIGIPVLGMPETTVKGIPRQTIKALVAQLMGNAVVARNYPSVDDFLADDTQHLMPFQRELQISINAIWQLEGGPYDWQFDDRPFTSSFSWNTTTIPAPSNYWTLTSNAINDGHTLVEANQYQNTNELISTRYNQYIYADFFENYCNLFINQETGKYYLVTDSGQYPDTYYYPSFLFSSIYYENGIGTLVSHPGSEKLSCVVQHTTPNLDTFLEIAQYIFNNEYLNLYYDYYYNGNKKMVYKVNLSTFVKHVYVGTNWLDKHELFNLTNLNISDDMNDYFRSPDQDVYFDIKDLLENLVNQTSIWDYLIDHLFDIDGNLILPNFPTFSVDLTPITDLLAPPIPINLNDISSYTENDYLDLVKEHGENFGETIGEYVAFWHNSDPEITYVIFGSLILSLIGAFIGKWGHG